MKKIEILQKIIRENGSCDWVFTTHRHANVCHFCPLGRLRLKSNGEYYSCADAVLGEKEHNDEPQQIDSLYKEEAERVLAQIIINEELGLDESDGE